MSRSDTAPFCLDSLAQYRSGPSQSTVLICEMGLLPPFFCSAKDLGASHGFKGQGHPTWASYSKSYPRNTNGHIVNNLSLGTICLAYSQPWFASWHQVPPGVSAEQILEWPRNTTRCGPNSAPIKTHYDRLCGTVYMPRVISF